MKSYGQFCPIAKAAELFCERWTPLVIRNISAGAHRFTDIHRGAPLMSATLLSQRLKSLEAEGIVTRTRAAEGKHWEYRLTEAGTEFVPVVSALGVWGRRWTRRSLEAGELDLGLLIWGLEHCVEPAALGDQRRVVLLRISDQPAHKACYWFLCERGSKQLCVTDPGHEVDLYLTASLGQMIHVYRGDISVARALETGALEAHGPSALVRRLEAFLNLGPLANVPLGRPEG